MSSQKLNVGPAQTVSLSFPVPAALLAGSQSVGTYVQIEDAFDSNLINTNGAQVLTGLMASSER